MTYNDMLPLFQAYPLLKENLPYVHFGVFPTPVQLLDRMGNGNQVYIKRDDQTGEVYGGNKIRKLEFLLGDALKQGAKEVLTFGCDGSNHALATGIYAIKLGLHSTSILRTQYNAQYVRKNLLKSLYYGIELRHRETLEEMEELVKELQEQRKAQNKQPIYEIPMGGSSPLGNVGFVNAAFELKQQIDAGLLPEPDYIYAAAGTMGTVVGLMIGLKVLGLKTQVVPIRVNNNTRVNTQAMTDMLNATAKLLHKADPAFPLLHYSEDDVHLIHDYFGEDYALFTEKGMAAVKSMKNYGIEIEGTYTGKTFAALLDATQNKAHQNQVFLFWNTLNSRMPKDNVLDLDYHALPQDFHFYFETEVQKLDQ